MAEIYNNQRRVGVVIVADGETMYNRQLVRGLRDVGAVLIDDNKLTVGVDVLDSGEGVYNDMPITGVVMIDDGRVMYNNQPVWPSTTAKEASGGGDNGPVPGIAGTRFQAATAGSNIAANFTSRRSHYANAAGDVSNIQCVDVGWYMSEGGAVAGGGARIKRALEYPEGVMHPVTWAGAANTRVEGAIATAPVVSDVVLSSVTGEPLVIPAGALFFERTVNMNAAAASFPVMVTPAGCSVLGLPDGNSTSDLIAGGAIAATSTTNTFGATCMIATIASSAARSFSALGDSICYGQGDNASVGVCGGSGWVARMLDAAGHSYFKCAYPGQSASELAAATNGVSALLDLLPVTDAIVEYGVNDLRIGRPVNSLLADLQTIHALTDAPRKWQTTITPRTDSSDGWASVAGQTGKTDGTMSSLNTLNDTIRAGLPNVTGVIDTADAAMSARNSDLWSGPFPVSTDGTHPNSPRAAALAAALVGQL